eukprot:807417-Prorocentrum_minimum.AAC.1
MAKNGHEGDQITLLVRQERTTFQDQIWGKTPLPGCHTRSPPPAWDHPMSGSLRRSARRKNNAESAMSFCVELEGGICRNR